MEEHSTSFMVTPLLASLIPAAREVFNKAVVGLSEGESREFVGGTVQRTTDAHYTITVSSIEMVFWSDGECVVPLTFEHNDRYTLTADVYVTGEIDRIYSKENQGYCKQIADQWLLWLDSGAHRQLPLSIAA